MRYLLFSVLVIFSIGVFTTPNALAQSNSTSTETNPSPPTIYFNGVLSDSWQSIYHHPLPQINRTALNDTGYTQWWSVSDKPRAVSDPEITNLQNVACQPGVLADWHHPRFAEGWSYTFPVGETTVICTGEDESGNVGTGNFILTVMPPGFTNSTSNPYLSDGTWFNTEPLSPPEPEAETTAEPEAETTAEPEVTPTLTISMDKTYYYRTVDELVEISIDSTQDPNNVRDIKATIFAPNGNLIAILQIDGDETSYQLPLTGISAWTYSHALDQTGTYTIKMEIDMPNPPPRQTLTFTLLPNPNTVYNAAGSSTPGCEATNNCFMPSTIAIAIGETVTWENTDNAAHTATSGSPTDGPDGVWDSSLMMVGGSYSVTLDEPGTYPYMCMVHPWMQGIVIVGDAAEIEAFVAAQEAAEDAEEAATAAADAAWAEANPGVVKNAPGSATPGCEETNSCFIPSTITVSAGQGITWYNDDNAAHTATSGSPTDGPDGVWDTSLMMVGGSFNLRIDEPGTYPYFCMVHPWMTGTVVVEGATGQAEDESEQIEFEPPPEAVETEAEVVSESDEITTGSEIQIETDIVNQQDGSQIFAYIVQIKYEDGTPVSISTVTGSLAQGQTLTQTISWTPDQPGTYVAEIFIWDDLDNANPLSSVEVQYFTVT